MNQTSKYLKPPTEPTKLSKREAEAFVMYAEALDEACRQILEDEELKKDHDLHAEASKDPEFQRFTDEDPTY